MLYRPTRLPCPLRSNARMQGDRITLRYAEHVMNRRISAKWTDRVQRGSHVRKIARYRQTKRDVSVSWVGRRMTADEAMEFALAKYEVALRRLALNN